MKKLFLLIAIFALAFPVYATAEERARPIFFLSEQDKKDISRIEAYLNDLKTVSADFLQVSDSGKIMRGSLAISRPGKMRVMYDPPSKDFIIADGSMVHIWDDALQAQTSVAQGSNLAEFILRDPLKLDGDVVVTQVRRFPAKIEVTLIDSKDEGAGNLTLVFEDNPLKLRQWKVVDSQGVITGVSLENMSVRPSFPRNYFIFTPPKFTKKH